MSNSNMDPFDEFEFKPLTDGLGFHKKSQSLKEGLKTSGVLQDELQGLPSSIPKDLLDDDVSPSASLKKHTFEDVLQALEKSPLPRPTSGISASGLEFTETLPRENTKREAQLEPSRTPVQSPFPRPDAYQTPLPGTPAGLPDTNLKLKVKKPSKGVTGDLSGPGAVSNVGMRRGAADSPKSKALEAATMSLPSAFLDFIIVMALAIVFLVALLMVTKVDLNVVLKNLNRDLMTQLSLGIMFIAVMQMYVVIARSFFGRTLGEWTFDLQVGKDAEQTTESYPLRVAFRSLLTTMTGLILLPVISVLVRRDIAGSLSGVKLYRQRF